MRGPTKDNLSLTADDVRTEAHARLKGALSLTASGYSVNADMLIDVLLHAAATGRSVEGACDDLLSVADANTAREYLNGQLTDAKLDILEHRMNQALGAELPRKVRRAKLDIALDLHDQPFYGKTAALREKACRGEARDGTTRFFRIASAYVMLGGVRVTLAVVFVTPALDLPLIVRLMVERVRKLGLTIGRLWMDRGFESVEIFDFLRFQGLPAIVALTIRGKTGGVRALCTGRRSYTTQHTFRRAGYGAARIQVALVHRRKSPNAPRQPEWMAFAQIAGHLTAHQVRDNYRRRFGIESSYRQMRQVRIKTNTRNPALRFVYLALALVLRNVWVTLRFAYCQLLRRGRAGRSVNPLPFKLRRMAAFLQQAIEHRYGLVSQITAHALPLNLESVVH